MVERSRIWRGPWRAPGRFVVPPSQGTPTMPISTSAGSRNSGRRMNVATSPKRGRGRDHKRVYRYSLGLQKSLAGCDEFVDRRHKPVTFGFADHDVERHEAAPGDPDA